MLSFPEIEAMFNLIKLTVVDHSLRAELGNIKSALPASIHGVSVVKGIEIDLKFSS